MTAIERLSKAATSDTEFYDKVAESLGKEKLEAHEANKAYSVRLNAIFNFEFHGKTPSPYPNDKLIASAWDIAQSRLAQHHHLFSNPAH